MIVLKREHEALMRAKDEQIAQLLDEVLWLRNLVRPNSAKAARLSQEADAVLESRQDQQELPDGDMDEHARAVKAEAERLLAGTY